MENYKNRFLELVKLLSGKMSGFLWLFLAAFLVLETLIVYSTVWSNSNLNDLSNKKNNIFEINAAKYISKENSITEKIASVSSTPSEEIISITVALSPTTLPSFTPTPIPTKSAGEYIEKVVVTDRGKFNIKMVEIDTSKGVKMITDSASDSLCTSNCPALSLEDYIKKNHGFAGINGTYFCPPDYPVCQYKSNTFETVFYNSRTSTWMNNSNYRCPGFTAEIDGIHFNKDVDTLAKRVSDARLINAYYPIYAGIFHCPKLVEDKKIVVDTTVLDAKEKVRGTKSGIGLNGKDMYLIVANNVNAQDFASIFKDLGAESGFLLDGGGSSALWYEGYKAGPGRNMPNAVVFSYDSNFKPSSTITTIPSITPSAVTVNILYLLRDSYENDLLYKDYEGEYTIVPSPASIFVKAPSTIKFTEVSPSYLLFPFVGISDEKKKMIYSKYSAVLDNNQYLIAINGIFLDYKNGCSVNETGISCFYKNFKESNFLISPTNFEDAGYYYDKTGKFALKANMIVAKHRFWLNIVKTSSNKYFSDDEITMWIDILSSVETGPAVK